MTAKKVLNEARPDLPPRYSASLQGGWPMVENAARRQRVPRSPSSGADEEAQRLATKVEAATGLPRTGGAPPSFDREMARALVDAGYMPLADYVALYGNDMATDQESWQPDFHEAGRVTGQFAAFPRRQSYRVANIHCTFAKAVPRRASKRRKA